MSGQIGRSSVTEGALVTASQSTALATIKQLDPLYVDLAQPSSELLNLRRKAISSGTQPSLDGIEILLDDGAVAEHTASLQFSEVTVNESTGSVTVRALLPNPDKQLLPGMFVRANVPTEIMPQAVASAGIATQSISLEHMAESILKESARG
ncbi:MAG: efflux RND transporter periplasmic adaptor subunit [Shewanella xiamenensis]|nr:efflux RND transporter periplasmic adaptor subunit [Shewanella xiamenensis]